MNDLEKEILSVYFTSPENLIPFLRQLDKESIIYCLAHLIHLYATDVNSSALREAYTLIKAGCSLRTKKLGYNGETADSKPCDVKPINIRCDSGEKLNGGGNFSDFTYERLERYLKDDVVMLVSGFVDGHLVYILQFPFSALEKEMRRQLDRFFGTRQRQPGEYLRSASFSFKHYKDNPHLMVIYKVHNLSDFKGFLTADLYRFLRGKE